MLSPLRAPRTMSPITATSTRTDANASASAAVAPHHVMCVPSSASAIQPSNTREREVKQQLWRGGVDRAHAQQIFEQERAHDDHAADARQQPAEREHADVIRERHVGEPGVRDEVRGEHHAQLAAFDARLVAHGARAPSR